MAAKYSRPSGESIGRIRQVWIRQAGFTPSTHGFGQPVILAGGFQPKIAAAGMDHQPDEAVIPLLNFNKMIAAAQRPQLMAR